MKSETKKVIKKMVTIPGQKEKVPMFVIPPGMGSVALEKHFDTTSKDEMEFEVENDSEAIGDTFKEDLGFKMSYQRYRDEGEISSPEVEDFIYQRQANKYYNEKDDRHVELTSIYRN